MTRTLAIVAAALLTTTVGATACARAQPQPPTEPPATPQSGAACADAYDGALTALPMAPGDHGNTRNLLQCSDGIWQRFLDPYPSSDRWLTTGPQLVLHGQGRRNPEIKAGAWTGTPQGGDAQCTAESVDVVGPGTTDQPRTDSADPGQSVTFDVSDHLFTVKLGGVCLWERD